MQSCTGALRHFARHPRDEFLYEGRSGHRVKGLLNRRLSNHLTGSEEFHSRQEPVTSRKWLKAVVPVVPPLKGEHGTAEM